MRYEHTQRGTVLLLTFLLVAILLLTVGRLAQGMREVLFTLIGILGICGFLFSSLTIQITDRALRWQFGPGLIRKEVSLREIERAEVTETTLLQGWGIHYTYRGWLYNVSGFQAVAVRLKSGKQFLLGTDEPKRLCDAISLSLS
jgi:uncharacterized membrane protein YccF (DUF307 family)